MNDFTIEETGYSYSGIADILLNEGKGPSLELLSDLVTQFMAAKEKCDILEAELNKAKEHRGLLVNCFTYAHKALKLGADQPLVIRQGIDSFFVAKIMENNHVEWAQYKATIPY